MSITLIAIAIACMFLLAALAWALIWQRERRNAVWREKSWLPRSLRSAQLLFAEPKPIVARNGPIALVAKPDRAYRRADGKIVLAELKSRERHTVYTSDVIEMSVQRAVIEGQAFGSVDEEAFVVTHHPTTGNRCVHTVRLMTVEQTYALALRYRAIMDGREQPTKRERRSVCDSCVHIARCRPVLR